MVLFSTHLYLIAARVSVTGFMNFHNWRHVSKNNNAWEYLYSLLSLLSFLPPIFFRSGKIHFAKLRMYLKPGVESWKLDLNLFNVLVYLYLAKCNFLF